MNHTYNRRDDSFDPFGTGMSFSRDSTYMQKKIPVEFDKKQRNSQALVGKIKTDRY